MRDAPVEHPEATLGHLLAGPVRKPDPHAPEQALDGDPLVGLVGLHPLAATERREDDARVRELRERPRVVAGALVGLLDLELRQRGDQIRKAGVPVIVHPTMARDFGETENMSKETAALLRRAGIPVALQSGYESYVPFTQLGSNLGDNSLLRVDGIANKFQMYGLCTLDQANLGLCAYPNTFQPGVATWVNALTLMKAIKANKVAPGAPATQTLSVNIGGTITAQRTPTCP